MHPLQPGDWVVQNAANSGVGRSLIALAKLRGLKTINLARDDATFAELTAAGADVVHVDDPDAVGDVRAVIGDARVALAVEAVGGPGVARLLELLSDGGWLVSYSWARDEPMWVDTSTLVGKHLTVRGFFVGDFDYRDKVAPVIREADRWWPTAPSLSPWRACTPWSISRTRCNISSVAARSC